MKLPKFIIGKNPMIDECEYIAHTRDPVFFAKVIVDDWKDWVLVPDREIPEGLKNRMNDWYKAYSIHQNKALR